MRLQLTSVLKSVIVNPSINKVVGPPYCRAENNVRWPCRMLLHVRHDAYTESPTGQTDRRTDARPLHYAFG